MLCYELHLAATGKPGTTKSPSLATIEEVEQMYGDLQAALIRISMISADHPEAGMMKLRRFLSRAGLLSHEVRMIRGLTRQILWYGEAKAHEALERGLRQEE